MTELSRADAILIGAEIAKAIQKSGGFGQSTASREVSSADKERSKKNSEILSTAKEIAEDLADIKDTSSDNSEKQQTTLERLHKSLDPIQKMPGYLSEALANSGSSFAQSIANNIKTEEDAGAAQEKLRALTQVSGVLSTLAMATADNSTTFEEAYQQIRDLGFSMEDTKEIMKDFAEIATDGNNEIKAGSKAYKQSQEALKKFDVNVVEAGKAVGKFGDKIEPLIKKAEQRAESVQLFATSLGKARNAIVPLVLAFKMTSAATRSAAQFGEQLDIAGANIRGMQMGEWAETLNSSRTAILAMSGGVTQFTSIVGGAAAEGLVAFTGSLPEANKGLAAMTMNSRLLGDSTVDSASYVKQQTSLFKDLNKTMGMTIQDFTAMNNELINDADIRNVMVRLGEKERTQYFQQMQRNVAYYKTQGLLQQQAMALAKSMERAAGDTAKTRMKKGATLASLMGAIGLGDKADRARQLEMKGTRRTEEEKIEYGKLLKEVKLTTEAMKQQGLVNELSVDAMLEKAGVDERLAMVGDLALSQGAKARDKNVEELRQRTVVKGASDEMTGKMLTVLDQTSAFLQGPYMQLVTGIFFGVSTIATVIGGIAAGIAGLLALPVLITAGISALALTVAAALGSVVGSIISSFIPTDALITIGGTIAEMPAVMGRVIDKVLSPSSWFSDEEDTANEKKKNIDETKAMQQSQLSLQSELVSEVKSLRNTAAEANVIAQSGNKNTLQVVDETKKGNMLKEKQTQNENVKLRTYSTRQAFPGIPNPA